MYSNSEHADKHHERTDKRTNEKSSSRGEGEKERALARLLGAHLTNKPRNDSKAIGLVEEREREREREIEAGKERAAKERAMEIEST